MRHEEKIPGGKMLAVDVVVDGSRVSKVRITGDFFLHPEDALLAIEDALTGIDVGTGEDELSAMVASALAGATLIGATSQDIARIFRRALS